MIYDMQSFVTNLFKSGWKSADRERLIREYDLTEDEVDNICEWLKDMEMPYLTDAELFKAADEAKSWDEYSLGCLKLLFQRHDLDMDKIWETEDMEDPCELQKYIEPYVREEN